MDNLKEVRGGCFALTAGGLVEGTDAGTFKTVNTVTFTIDGVFKSKAATDNLTFSAGHTTVPVSSSVLFLVCINAAGTVSTVQGKIVLTAGVTAGTTPLEYPEVPADVAAIGYVRIDTSASVPFVPGTSDLSLSGITDTWGDLMVVPSKPIVA